MSGEMKKAWPKHRFKAHDHKWVVKWEGEMRYCTLCGQIQNRYFDRINLINDPAHESGWATCTQGGYRTDLATNIQSPHHGAAPAADGHYYLSLT